MRPSFGTPYEIDLSRDIPVYGQTTWRLTRRSRLGKPERSLAVEASDAEFVLGTLAEAEVKLVPDGIMGLDGVSYDLSIGAGFNAVRLAWWFDLPKQWEPIAPALNRLHVLGLIADVPGAGDDPHA